MISYRFCFLDHRDHVLRSEILEFIDDAQACEQAKTLFKQQSPQAIEVWQDRRFVCRASDAGTQRAATP
jgi:hypothetical protein